MSFAPTADATRCRTRSRRRRSSSPGSWRRAVSSRSPSTVGEGSARRIGPMFHGRAALRPCRRSRGAASPAAGSHARGAGSRTRSPRVSRAGRLPGGRRSGNGARHRRAGVPRPASTSSASCRASRPRPGAVVRELVRRPDRPRAGHVDARGDVERARRRFLDARVPGRHGPRGRLEPYARRRRGLRAMRARALSSSIADEAPYRGGARRPGDIPEIRVDRAGRRGAHPGALTRRSARRSGGRGAFLRRWQLRGGHVPGFARAGPRRGERFPPPRSCTSRVATSPRMP